MQPDGSIVAACSDGSLVRYDSSGNPDGTSFDSSIDGIDAVAIQPLGASFGIIAAGSGFSVARYNSDGSLDATFGNDGISSPLPLGSLAAGPGHAGPCPAGRPDRAGRICAGRQRRG